MPIPSLHDTIVKMGANDLSEFGFMIADQPGK